MRFVGAAIEQAVKQIYLARSRRRQADCRATNCRQAVAQRLARVSQLRATSISTSWQEAANRCAASAHAWQIAGAPGPLRERMVAVTAQMSRTS